MCSSIIKFEGQSYIMNKLLSLLLLSVSLAACNKDKFTTVPQISFNSLKPNTYQRGTPINAEGPKLSIQLKDAEGDFRFTSGKDTSYVYIKNLTIPPFNIDSIPFPSASALQRKDLDAEVVVDLKFGRGILTGTPNPPRRPFVDTVYFEVFVRDIAKNKSNVIKTADPLFFITP